MRALPIIYMMQTHPYQLVSQSINRLRTTVMHEIGAICVLGRARGGLRKMYGRISSIHCHQPTKQTKTNTHPQENNAKTLKKPQFHYRNFTRNDSGSESILPRSRSNIYDRPCAQQYVGKYYSRMVTSGRLTRHARTRTVISEGRNVLVELDI